MPEIDVTPAIRDTLDMLITTEVYRTGEMDPQLMDDLTGLLAAHNWSPQMRSAIAQLADLRAGRICCVRTGETDR